jgi:N-carbamoyl-L-amino-acid hydrolase
MTLDVRNTDEGLLQQAEAEISRFIDQMADRENVVITTRTLARFEPVEFDQRVIEIIAEHATSQGNTVDHLPSGAGHDAQMLARVCPTAMIFTQSQNGLSHNPAEYTSPDDLVAGANVLLATMLTLCETSFG